LDISFLAFRLPAIARRLPAIARRPSAIRFARLPREASASGQASGKCRAGSGEAGGDESQEIAIAFGEYMKIKFHQNANSTMIQLPKGRLTIIIPLQADWVSSLSSGK